MAKRAQVPVVAGPDRCLDIQLLRSKYNCDVVISDDGLQHYKLHRDIEIVLVDGERQLGNGCCLPAGPLRENARRLKSVDFVLLNSSHHQHKQAFMLQHQIKSVFLMGLEGKIIYSLSDNKSQGIQSLKGVLVHAVTGIGNPQRFYQTLENEGVRLIKHSFPDHHVFSQEELNFNDKKIIIMTEKDAVKCQNFSLDNVWYLPVKAQIEEAFDKQVLDKLSHIIDNR